MNQHSLMGLSYDLKHIGFQSLPYPSGNLPCALPQLSEHVLVQPYTDSKCSPQSIFGLVFVKYINGPIIFLCVVTSTISEEVSLNNFRFVTIGLGMDLRSIISNLFRISTTYFPWLRKISFGFYYTSRPMK
jgi:hypothetical protein